jgi:hypothetical protein
MPATVDPQASGLLQLAVTRDGFQRAVMESELGPMTRFVLLVLSTFADPDGSRCWPSKRAVVASTGLGEHAVKKHLGTARKLGWIASEARQGHSNVWGLRVPIASGPSGGGLVDRGHAARRSAPEPIRTPLGNGRKVVDNSAQPFRGGIPGIPTGGIPGIPGGGSLGSPIPRHYQDRDQARARPPWCGTCDERTRHRTTDEATGAVRFCPDCHPSRAWPRRKRSSRSGTG